MEVFEAIQRRRSVRSYLPDQIPEDKLRKVIEAARLAPSAGNLQPWHFVVVTDSVTRKRLLEGRAFSSFLSEAPVVIVGCGNRRTSPRWHLVDTAIAMENMVLAATGEGLGTCWIGDFDEERVKQLLAVPPEFDVVALLALGYPREKKDLFSEVMHLVMRRKRLDDIASLEGYGRPFGKRSEGELNR
jgi:nitroreductase